jgi:Secretion system C-terminal sorting domain/Low-density lipoprotein receptor repeat class B
MKKTFLFLVVSFISSWSVISAQGLFWTEIGGGKIDSSGFSGPGVHILADSLSSPYCVAFERNSGLVYWTDVVGGKIWRMDHDGSNRQTVLSGLDLPRGLAIDNGSHMLYWVENGSKKIRAANFDGTNMVDILTTGLVAPTQIALDERHSEIYWTDNGGTERKIGMCRFDGSVPTIIDSTTSFVSGINVDTVNSKIYWTEYGVTDRIRSANLDGTDTVDVDTLVSAEPRGVFVDVFHGKIFWTAYISNSIERANLDGTNKSVLASGLNNPLSVSSFEPTGTTGVRASNSVKTYVLSQNYPNPFNPSTEISYQIPAVSFVTLKVYDVLGREAATLVNRKEDAGTYRIRFDGSNFSSGVYFYRLIAGTFTSTKKLLLMK